jgi:hypothetical protein
MAPLSAGLQTYRNIAHAQEYQKAQLVPLGDKTVGVFYYYWWHNSTYGECRKKPVQTMISYSVVTGFLKIHPIHFLIALSGHNYLIFWGSLTLFSPILAV